MIQLVVATGNAHKLGEIKAVLGAGHRYLSLGDFPAAPKVREDAATFAANARKKAVGLAAWLFDQRGQPSLNIQRDSAVCVLADDSGLEVDFLNGAPGVHSARFAALDTSSGNSLDEANNAKLLNLLAGIDPQRKTGRFRCVIALTSIPTPGNSESSTGVPDWDVATKIFEGVCEGRIAEGPRGKSGFGYDPLFIPTGHTESFAELGEDIKNQFSHRARALAKLKEYLLSIESLEC